MSVQMAGNALHVRRLSQQRRYHYRTFERRRNNRSCCGRIDVGAELTARYAILDGVF